MDTTQQDPIRHWFADYAQGFADADGRLPAMQQLKYDHSLKVAANARFMATRMAWAPEEVRIGDTAGLLHDVGRFTQYAEFRTFSDAISVNHAERGYEVLRQSAVLSRLGDDCQRAIEVAVRFHNRPRVPADLAEASRRLLLLVRDADKLDIFEILDDAVRNDKVGLYPEIALHVDLKGAPTAAIIAAVQAREPVPYHAVKSLADFFVMQMNWMYDLNYPAALELVHERDVVRRLGEHLAPYPEVSSLVEAATAYVRVRGGGEG
ncbi:MAG: hypothetical protein A3K19_09435 [Lentisphaerae bacterium RIFOXYB12_FULL_65_16]|nr:MAG: hypothetical protein A3K18_22450 [Lentisphaerae bacterium RIFOXYA12_64_32]OGV90417.1 MAG: hypothetical protein A3K19_09435 [Lentisphaerae bacterium RIFOXYB12_FULL_65_16]